MLNRLRREKIENIAVTTLNETSQTVTVAGEKLQARIVRETGIEGRTNTPSRSTADVKQPAEKVPAPPSVKQTSLVPKPSASASPSSSLPTGDYWRIQMGSFPDEAGAKLQISKLAKTNVTAEILPAEVNGKTVYRVMSKPLTTEAQVESLRALLSLNGINHFVKRFK
jgi:cell division protein FtsN